MAVVDLDVAPNADIKRTKLLDGKDIYGPRTLGFPLGQRQTGGLFSPDYFPGQKALNILRLAANVAAAETITIGPVVIDGVSITDVFVVEAITTNMVATQVGAIDAVANPVLLTLSAAPPIVVSVGDMLRSTNEIVKVLRVIAPNQFVVARARGGTTIATHAAADAWFQAAVPTPLISLPFNATLTPAVAGPCIAAEINNVAAGSSGERAASRTSRIYKLLKATSFQAGAEVALEGLNPGLLTVACAETLAGAANAWVAANMYGGAEPAFKKHVEIARVPNAGEVLATFMHFPLDFVPTYFTKAAYVTATGVSKAITGGLLYDATNRALRLDNTGATAWAATDTVLIEARE